MTPLSEVLKLSEVLTEKGLTFCCAESCTGGLLSAQMTDIFGASEFFLGGVTAYSYESKKKVLGVSAETLDGFGAVSAEAAGEMVRGVMDAFGSDTAVAITGIAGPAGGTPEKPVGLVFVAVADGPRVVVSRNLFNGDRDDVRESSVRTAAEMLLDLLEGRLRRRFLQPSGIHPTMQKIMTGKVKEVYEVDEDTLEFAYTDNISVFDKIIPSQIPHKGESLCRTAKHWFEILNEEGIRNHYLEGGPEDRMRVRRVRVIRDYSQIDGATTNYLIPLEVICRYYAAGSLVDRLRSGKVSPEDLGFPAGHEVALGERLPRPFIECTTKLEEHDENLTEEEAKEMAGLSDAEYEEIKATVLRIDAVMERETSKRGLIHVDGKKEFGFDGERRLMVVDTFGTLDEDRWWDAADYAQGRLVDLSKEVVRQYYRGTGYHKALYDAREKGLPEPDIPALPDDVVSRVSDLYVGMYERITGERFRSLQVDEGQPLPRGARHVGPDARDGALVAVGDPGGAAEAPVLAAGVVAGRRGVRERHALQQPLPREDRRRGDLGHLDDHRRVPLQQGAPVLLGPHGVHAVAAPGVQPVADPRQRAALALLRTADVRELGSRPGHGPADERYRHRITPVASATLRATSSDTPPSPRMVNLSERISCACDSA